MKELRYDVVCVGGGPGGFPAAIAAARGGARTLLVERNHFLGGMAATGLGLLGYLDAKGRPALGGIAQEFVDRLTAKGGAMGHFRCPVHNSITPVNPELVKLAALEMCREAGVELLFHCEPTEAKVREGRLEEIVLYGKTTYVRVKAEVFIDATGDGDLAALAGAEYVYGQDKTGLTQPATLMFTVCGVDMDRLLSYVEEHPEEVALPEGYTAAYTPEFFRNTKGHCLIGFPSLLEEARSQGSYHIPRDRFIYITSAEPGRLAVNSTRMLSVDATDPESISQGIVEGSLQVLELLSVMQKHLPGFEHCRLSAVSPMLGVRESRHFIGRRRLTGNAVRASLVDGDTIALGAYNIDVHAGRGVGIRLDPIEKPYGVPLGALVPAKLEGLLLSGRTIDADAEAFGSCRVMGTCMAIGEAAGVCAALAVSQGKTPSQCAPESVRSELIRRGAIC